MGEACLSLPATDGPMPDSLRSREVPAADVGAMPPVRVSPARPTTLQLMAQEALLSKTAARALALAVVAGRVSSTELCRAVDGRVVYAVLIAEPGRGPKRVVLIDARSGAVVREEG